MINKILCLLFAPKYIVVKGIQIENRAVMFLGINPVLTHDKGFGWIVNFSNRKSSYYVDNIYTVIWSRKSLRKWRKLLGRTGEAVLIRKSFKWRKL